MREHLESGRLRRVPDAPEFLYPDYAVFAEGADESVVRPALDGLRHAARPQEGGSPPPRKGFKRTAAQGE